MCIRDSNDPPEITGQQTLTTDEEQALDLSATMLTVADPDVDPRFHADYALTVYGGDHYTHAGATIIPDDNYFGNLAVPVSVSDGAAESAAYSVAVTVVPVPDAPAFTSMPPTNAVEGELYTYLVTTQDPDGEFPRIQSGALSGWLALVDHGDGTATLSGTPGGADAGTYALTLQAIDNVGLSAEQPFTLTVAVAADVPVIEILGATPLTITQGQAFVDPGATASDAQDGDLTAAIVTDSNVNSAMPGTYEVTYSVSDTAGHTVSATRTGVVLSRPTSSGGGGGGSLDGLSMGVLLSLALMIAAGKRKIRRRVGP